MLQKWAVRQFWPHWFPPLVAARSLARHFESPRNPILPWPIVDHRAYEVKGLPFVIGDDEKGRLELSVMAH